MDYSIYSIVGKENIMRNGQKCKVVEDNGAFDISVKFEDGVIVTHKSRREFRTGLIRNPNFVYGSIIGQSKKMACGMQCTVIKDDSYWDVTVRFDDGTIVSKVDRQKFRRGVINNPSLGTGYERYQEKLRLIGQTKTMRCGMKCTVVEDKGANDITVRFEDGSVREHCKRGDFLKERIANLNLGVKYSNRKSILGKENVMSCGMKCTVIKDNGYKNIVVRFEDGYTVKSRRDAFNNGNIRNPNYLRGSILGEKRIMSCGMACEVVKDFGDEQITVRFEDGYIRENCSRANFKKGKIRNPSVEGSFPQAYIFYNIKRYFPDAKYNFRPEWLKSSKGFPYEIDVWIPSKCIGIEYDGAFFHSKETSSAKEKSEFIAKSSHVEKLVTILEKGALKHESLKHANYQLDFSSHYYEYNYLIIQLRYVLVDVLKLLGIENPEIETNKQLIQQYKIINCHNLDRSRSRRL